jgi:hypothetical protein
LSEGTDKRVFQELIKRQFECFPKLAGFAAYIPLMVVYGSGIAYCRESDWIESAGDWFVHVYSSSPLCAVNSAEGYPVSGAVNLNFVLDGKNAVAVVDN